MRKLLVTFQLILCFCLFAAHPALAKVFQSVDKTYTAPVAPLDLAVSSDGNYTYILGANGKIVIYTRNGEKEEISIGGNFDRIVTSGNGDKIWVSNQKTKEIKEVFIDFLKKLTSDGSPFLGEEKAPVVITVFSDFQCPHCAQLGELYPKLLEKYPTSIKIVFKYFPLPNHQFSGAAAVASWAAQQQGKFWQYHDLVYENFRDLTLEKLTGFAEQLGLNMPQFQQQMNSQEAKNKVIQDIQEGQTSGVTSTPTIYINGRLARERSLVAMEKMIDESLKK